MNNQDRKAQTHCKYGHEFTPKNTIVSKSGGRGCRLCTNERHRIQRKEHPERFKKRFPSQKSYYRTAVWREKQYGLSPERYKQLYDEQDGMCCICWLRPIYCVDHEHCTGLFRGLLCNRCNAGLGMFGDDPNVMLRAIEYLRRTRYVSVPLSYGSDGEGLLPERMAPGLWGQTNTR